MQSAVTVCLVPEVKSGPFVFSSGLEDACARAAELGFDAIEVFPRSGAEVDGSALADLLTRHRLRLAAMGTGAGWVVQKLTLVHGDSNVRQEARAFIRGIIDLAARFNAPAIIGSMQGRWDGSVTRDAALAFLAEALNELGEHAAGRGVPLLYEPLNRYETNLLNRLGDTAAFVRGLKTRNVRILADLFHMNIDEANSAAALLEAGSLIGHVHFADSNREAIGRGQTIIAPVIAALRKIGYDGYLSAEVFPRPDPLSAARQTLEAFRAHVKNR